MSTEAAPASTRMRDERRVVTVFSADIVGSTGVAERLDPEEYKLLVADALGRIVHAVHDLGGTVKDLAGDGVLALFGAPTAHEDDPERAVRAGLAIVGEMADYGAEVARAWGVIGFAVRVGINTGPVVLGPVGAGERVEYSAYGDAVNVASRLQAAAEPSAVLVAEATRRAVQPLFEWGERRELTLKGKADVVAAYEALRVKATSGKARPTVSRFGRLVGRERELELLREPVAAVATGSGGVVFLSGEPGIGKTRLLIELRQMFRSAVGSGPATWLEGRCLSYGESLPYWPFRDLLREWLGAAEDDPELRVRIALRRKLAETFGERADEPYPYLMSLMGLSPEPDASARLTQLSPEALQYRTFEVVGELVARLAQRGPTVLAVEDLHWADATSVQLLERLLPLTDESALLIVVTQRLERDQPGWLLRDVASRTLPHRTREVQLEALSGEAENELLHNLVGESTLPESLERKLLAEAEGNPFYLEELVRSLADVAALVRDGDGWRFDHEVPIEIPETVENVILARIDRLPAASHEVLTAASVIGRRFSLPLLEVVAERTPIAAELHELQRLDLIREGRRWPQPEYRFKHALIQEAAYRSILKRTRSELHRRAADWLERQYGERPEDVAGLLAHHWLAAEDEDKAVVYLTKAGDSARQEYALDEAIGHYRELLPILERRGEAQQVALVLFKLALALHTSLRFAEANATYQQAFESWTPPSPPGLHPTALLRIGTSFLPNDADPKSAIAWPNIQLCMQLFDRLVEAWPERTIVPALADRWEISDDGLRYLFHLRPGLVWSDGVALTAYDVEFGIKRVLDPRSPGSSVAIYFVLENGQNYYLGRNADADRIGVRALDERTIEFRLVAPAPYFMSVMNRPDSGPQPRHAIERHGMAWTQPEQQVVSGPYAVASRTDDLLVLRRRRDYVQPRRGNISDVELFRSSIAAALPGYDRDESDMILVRYTPRLVDLMPGAVHPDANLGPAAWSAYLRFDHHHPIGSNLALRRALAHAIDREALAAVCPANLVVATGGVVPPAIQGHTPDIGLRFDPDVAREHLVRSGFEGELELAGMDVWQTIMQAVAASWERVFGGRVSVRTWSWRVEEAMQVGGRPDTAYLRMTGWFPGYPDPEYYLRLLFQSDSRTNEGGFSYAPLDGLIERARRERDGRRRLELFHEADRMAVADRIACIPIVYGRNVAYVKPRVNGWWEFGKSSASFADLTIEGVDPR